MKQILMIRHAESTNNASASNIEAQAITDKAIRRERIESERSADCDLTDRGINQAHRLASALAQRDMPSPLLVTSPMRRALLTANAVADALELPRERFLCRGDLFEVGGSYYKGRAVPTSTADQIASEFPVRIEEMSPSGWYHGHAGPEPLDHATQRVIQVVSWVESLLGSSDNEFETLLLVVHGDLMSRWLRRWMGVPIGRGLAFMHHNTGITSLSWNSERGVLLRGINDTTHLTDEMRTGDSDGWWQCVLPDLQVRTYTRHTDVPSDHDEQIRMLRKEHLWSLEPPSGDGEAVSARSVHILAESAGRIVGGAQFDPETNRVRQVVVDPGYRRHGIGRRIVGQVGAVARNQGRRELAVHAWESSVPFYRRAGFEPDGPPRNDSPVPWRRMIARLAQ